MRKQDHHRRGDDAGLEAAARPVIAMELHIERKQQNERQDQLGADAQDEIEAHFRVSSPSRPLRRAPRNSSITPMPAVKITVVSPSVS